MGVGWHDFVSCAKEKAAKFKVAQILSYALLISMFDEVGVFFPPQRLGSDKAHSLGHISMFTVRPAAGICADRAGMPVPCIRRTGTQTAQDNASPLSSTLPLPKIALTGRALGSLVGCCKCLRRGAHLMALSPEGGLWGNWWAVG